MKRFFTYLVILFVLMASCTTYNLMSSEAPAPQSQAESLLDYIGCAAGCLVIAKDCCDGCEPDQILAVAAECRRNECGD